MAKNIHGNDIYSMIIDIVMDLSPNQAEGLYAYLLPRYTTRARSKLYNADGEEDKNGKIRLLPSQYQAIRTKYGDNYMHKAFRELTNYILFLEKNQDIPKYKQKLKKLEKETHNMILASDGGWVYRKCKSYAVSDRVPVNVNPFLIDDLNTARLYIQSLPANLKDMPDVQSLLLRFPQLVDEFNDK
jgi:hypothetical protein